MSDKQAVLTFWHATHKFVFYYSSEKQTFYSVTVNGNTYMVRGVLRGGNRREPISPLGINTQLNILIFVNRLIFHEKHQMTVTAVTQPVSSNLNLPAILSHTLHFKNIQAKSEANKVQ